MSICTNLWQISVNGPPPPLPGYSCTILLPSLSPARLPAAARYFLVAAALFCYRRYAGSISGGISSLLSHSRQIYAGAGRGYIAPWCGAANLWPLFAVFSAAAIPRYRVFAVIEPIDSPMTNPRGFVRTGNVSRDGEIVGERGDFSLRAARAQCYEYACRISLQS